LIGSSIWNCTLRLHNNAGISTFETIICFNLMDTIDKSCTYMKSTQYSDVCIISWICTGPGSNETLLTSLVEFLSLDLWHINYWHRLYRWVVFVQSKYRSNDATSFKTNPRSPANLPFLYSIESSTFNYCAILSRFF